MCDEYWATAVSQVLHLRVQAVNRVPSCTPKLVSHRRDWTKASGVLLELGVLHATVL
jgi:hypothetical protein